MFVQPRDVSLITHALARRRPGTAILVGAPNSMHRIDFRRHEKGAPLAVYKARCVRDSVAHKNAPESVRSSNGKCVKKARIRPNFKLEMFVLFDSPSCVCVPLNITCFSSQRSGWSQSAAPRDNRHQYTRSVAARAFCDVVSAPRILSKSHRDYCAEHECCVVGLVAVGTNNQRVQISREICNGAGPVPDHRRGVRVYAAHGGIQIGYSLFPTRNIN